MQGTDKSPLIIKSSIQERIQLQYRSSLIEPLLLHALLLASRVTTHNILIYAGQATIISPRWLASNAADDLVLLARLERGAINQLPGLC